MLREPWLPPHWPVLAGYPRIFLPWECPSRFFRLVENVFIGLRYVMIESAISTQINAQISKFRGTTNHVIDLVVVFHQKPNNLLGRHEKFGSARYGLYIGVSKLDGMDHFRRGSLVTHGDEHGMPKALFACFLFHGGQLSIDTSDLMKTQVRDGIVTMDIVSAISNRLGDNVGRVGRTIHGRTRKGVTLNVI